jgi:hypothetical protein
MQAPGTFCFSQAYPQFAQNTQERLEALQCGPWAMAGGSSGQIPTNRRRDRPGKWSGRRVSSPETSLRPELGGTFTGERRWWRRGGASAAAWNPMNCWAMRSTAGLGDPWWVTTRSHTSFASGGHKRWGLGRGAPLVGAAAQTSDVGVYARGKEVPPFIDGVQPALRS